MQKIFSSAGEPGGPSLTMAWGWSSGPDLGYPPSHSWGEVVHWALCWTLCCGQTMVWWGYGAGERILAVWPILQSNERCPTAPGPLAVCFKFWGDRGDGTGRVSRELVLLLLALLPFNQGILLWVACLYNPHLSKPVSRLRNYLWKAAVHLRTRTSDLHCCLHVVNLERLATVHRAPDDLSLRFKDVVSNIESVILRCGEYWQVIAGPGWRYISCKPPVRPVLDSLSPT